MKASFYNIAIRAVNLIISFIFSILIVKIISLNAYGEYGLFISSVTLGGFLFSWDFYFFSAREIAKENSARKIQSYLSDQFKLHLGLYLLFSPFFIFLFISEFISWELIFIFFPILLFDNLAMECFRLLVATGRSTKANVVLFAKSATHIIVIIAIWQLQPENTLTLTYILILKAMASFIAFFIGIYFLKIDFKSFKQKTNFSWLKKGLSISVTFFMGTISFKIIEFLGRYLIDFHFSKSQVGIYTFYFALSNLVYMITQAGVFQVYSPRLIKNYKVNSSTQSAIFQKYFKEFKMLSFLSVIVIPAGILVFIPFLLEYLGKEELLLNLNVLYIIMLGTVLFTLSFIPHYKLYLQGKDKLILKSMLISLVFFIPIAIVLTPLYGINGMAIATSVGFMVILFCKLYFAFVNVKLS